MLLGPVQLRTAGAAGDATQPALPVAAGALARAVVDGVRLLPFEAADPVRGRRGRTLPVAAPALAPGHRFP